MMRVGQTTRAAESIRSPRLAMLVAALLALLWQGFVTQTHLHMDGVSSARIAALPGDQHTHVDRDDWPSRQPADCPICRETAQAGHYVAPADPAHLAAPAPAACILCTRPRRLTGTARTDLWRIRDPPEPART